MLRFILRRKFQDQYNGLQTESWKTLVCEVPELEELLCRGGRSENGYDDTELVGVEVLKIEKEPTQ